MRTLILVGLLIIDFSCPGQSDPVWQQGVVVLTTREVLSGEVLFNPLHEVVLFRSGDQVTVVPPYQIQLFRFYDRAADINRQFVAVNQERKPSRIYEVVVQGRTQVLRYLKVRMPFVKHDDIEGYHYVIRYGDELVPIQKFRSKVYDKLIREYPDELPSYIRDHHLNINDFKSVILIIKEYNRIDHPGPIIAQAD